MSGDPGNGKTCPRRMNEMGPWESVEGLDDIKHAHCTFCGSLDPAVFMARLEAGDVELGATDKNYKVYVINKGGEPFSDRGDRTKFYFPHLSVDQKKRFVDLHNERKIDMGRFNFYVLPYFMAPAEPAKEKG